MTLQVRIPAFFSALFTWGITPMEKQKPQPIKPRGTMDICSSRTMRRTARNYRRAVRSERHSELLQQGWSE